MRPSTILRTLNLRFPVRFSSSTVAPLPVQSSFDTWLTEQLHTLLCLKRKTVETETSYTSCEWLLQALDISIATQKMTVKSLNDDDEVNLQDGDREIIEEYLEQVIQLLDACNQLRERTGTIQNYVNSLRIVVHCLEGRTKPCETALARARIALSSCEAMERRSCDDQLEKCSFGLRKLAERLAQPGLKDSYMSNMNTDRFRQVLNGSKAVSLLTCGALAVSLSFKSKRGLPAAQNGEKTSSCNWSSSLKELEKEVKQEMEKCRKSCGGMVLNELREAVTAARNLREIISPRSPKNKARKMDLISVNVEDLGRSCEELEEGIKPLEGKVNELYRQLISVRVALLGILSQWPELKIGPKGRKT